MNNINLNNYYNKYNLLNNNNEEYTIIELKLEENDKYFNNLSNNEVILELEDFFNYTNKIKDKLPSTNNIFYANHIIYKNIIKNKEKLKFINIEDNKFYEVFNIEIDYDNNEPPIIYYYCNKENPFFLIQLYAYSDFYFYGYINTKIIYQINCFDSGQKRFIGRIINKLNYFENINLTNKKYLYIGFHSNIGHHLWNELSGLSNFLYNCDINLIDGIIIGPYDFFNIKSYILNKYNINIISYDESIHINIINHLPIFINSLYINKYLKDIMTEILIKNNINNEIRDFTKKNIEITLDIRTISRNLNNIENFYIKLINNIISDYEDFFIKINFTGRFITSLNNINLLDDVEFNIQNNIVNNIINVFEKNNKIIFLNLIGENFLNSIEKIIYSDISILTIGTSLPNLANWIFNIKTICFGPTYMYAFVPEIQYILLNNYDAILVDKEYITDLDVNTHLFDINYDAFYSLFNVELNKIINIT